MPLTFGDPASIQAIRWVYRRGTWFALGTLFKALGFYAKSSGAMDIPVLGIMREGRRRAMIGGGCWRSGPRAKGTMERKVAR